MLCRTRRDAERAQRGIGELLGRLKLQLHPEKTKLVGLWEGQAGFDFLGFQHRMVESQRKKGRYYPSHWPSQKAERSMRQKVKQVTGPIGRLREPIEVLIHELNQKIEGWATYYGFGTVSGRFCHMDWHIERRLKLYLNKKHRIHPRHQTGEFTTRWFRAKGLKSLRDTVQRRYANALGEGHRRAV